MKIAKLMMVSAAALAMGIATPALAQVGSSNDGFFSDDVANDFIDLLSNNNVNATSNSSSADQFNANSIGSGNSDDDLNGSFNGNSLFSGNSDDDDVSVTNTTSLQDNDATSFVRNISDDDTLSLSANVQDNGDSIVADQDLLAVITNNGIDNVVDLDEDSEFRTGSNSVNDGAFAAFAGVLTQSWNTGLNANTQAGTNIAAQGNVNFANGGPPPPQ